MTVLEMCVNLGDFLNDSTNASTGAGNRWSAAIKLRALNNAQDRFCSMVIDDALDEGLMAIKQISSIQSTGYALSGLAAGSKFFRYVNSKQTTDNVWITKIETGDLGREDNSLLAGTDDDPYCYILRDIYYLLSTNYSKNVDLWYIKKPSTLVVSSASAGEVTTCEINDMFHPTIVRMAEVELKKGVAEYTTQEVVALEQLVMQEIQFINATYTQLEAENESQRGERTL